MEAVLKILEKNIQLVSVACIAAGVVLLIAAVLILLKKKDPDGGEKKPVKQKKSKDNYTVDYEITFVESTEIIE